MGTTKALIVGVSEYFIDGADNLFFCKNDIIAMQDAFIYGLEVAEKRYDSLRINKHSYSKRLNHSIKRD